MTERTPPSDDKDEQGDTIVYQTEFDPTMNSVSEIVIRVVATLNNAEPTDLPLPSEVVDPEALDALFGPKASGLQRHTNAALRFEYDAYSVSVDSAGQITVYQSDSEIDD